MPNHRTIPLLTAVAVLFLLTGCGDETPSAPTADPTPTPTAVATTEPTTDPEPQVSAIVIDGDSVSVTVVEGGTILDIPFSTDPATAAAQLSDAIGLEPITSVTPPDSCGGDLTRVTWGGISFWSPYASAPPGMKFYASADAQKTSNGITVAMLGGQWVGYSGDDTIAAYGESSLLDFGMESIGAQVLAYDVKSGTDGGDPDQFWGGIAIIQDGLVQQFSAPIHYWYDC